jgi:hypothetical protein
MPHNHEEDNGLFGRESIILCQNLKVRSGMLADQTLIRNIPSLEDIPAIPAVPFHRRILFESLSLLHIF